MSILSEFKEFAVKGNVIDMAVGVIIGSAFGKIVSSLVSDIIMPPLGLLIGGMDFKDLNITLKSPEIIDGIKSVAVTINYGAFIQTVFDFTIIAFAIFMFIRVLSKFKKQAELPTSEPPPGPSKEEILLTEIRDLLKNK